MPGSWWWSRYLDCVGVVVEEVVGFVGVVAYVVVVVIVSDINPTKVILYIRLTWRFGAEK